MLKRRGNVLAYTREKLAENMRAWCEAREREIASCVVSEYEEIIDGKSVMVRVFKARKAFGVAGSETVGNLGTIAQGAE